jgi:putative Mn2+ efflux pump MntP
LSTELIIQSILLGAGLAMDAFSVSLADGLGERTLSPLRTLAIAGTFAAFQFAMPLIGWLLVRTAAEMFTSFQMFIPWIALILLLYIGGKMLIEGVRENRAGASEEAATDEEPGKGRLTAGDLVVQGIATSIDALSVGFTIAAYSTAQAFTSSAIIGIVTLFICIAGLHLGRKLGTRLTGRASMLGGVILIAIGIEIWMKGVFF